MQSKNRFSTTYILLHKLQGFGLSILPELDLRNVATVDGDTILIVGIGLSHETIQIVLRLISLRSWWLPIVRNIGIFLEIGKQIDLESMILVQAMMVEKFDSFLGIGWILVFQETVAFCVSFLVLWIEIVDDLSAGPKQLVNYTFQLFFTVRRYLGNIIYNNNALYSVRFAWFLS